MFVLQTLTLDDHLETPDDQVYHLIDLDTCDMPQVPDYYRRNENVMLGLPLCDDCDGTGNGFFHMFKACANCKGWGFTL